MFGGYVGRHRRALLEQADIGGVEARIKTLGGEVGEGHAVARIGIGDGLSDARGNGMGKRSGIGMGDDDEAVHGERPAD